MRVAREIDECRVLERKGLCLYFYFMSYTSSSTCCTGTERITLKFLLSVNLRYRVLCSDMPGSRTERAFNNI